MIIKSQLQLGDFPWKDVVSLPALKRVRPQRLALLIPAHNEALVLADTIYGAMAAQVKPRDIYVVDDSSTDATYNIAVELLGEKNVLHVERSGKALALRQAIVHFKIVRRYSWLQIIDADSIFSPDYFSQISQYFHPSVAAVCGQVKSLRHNWITSYRAYEYTVFQDFYKTLQGMANLITVMPGPATCFNTRVLNKIHFSNDTLTEDFDMTVQIHRLKLGRIVYAGKAHSWTQDPPTLRIYMKQINRWYTGFFQVMRKYRVGLQLSKIDLLLLFLTLDSMVYCLQLIAVVGLILAHVSKVSAGALFALDFFTLAMLATYASIRMRRIDLLTPMPFYYMLRILCVCLFLWAAVKVYLLPKSKKGGVWNTGRVVHQPAVINQTLKGGVSA